MLIHTPLQQIFKLFIIALIVWGCDENSSNEADMSPMSAVDMDRFGQNDQEPPSSLMDQGDSTALIDQGVDDPEDAAIPIPEPDAMMMVDEGVPTAPPQSQLAWSAPSPVRGVAGSAQVIEVQVHLNNLQRPISGWTLALTADRSQRCLIRELVIPQTLAASSESDEVGLRRGGIDNHRIMGGGLSALSEVILSLTEEVVVQPPSSPHPILRFLLQVTLPAANGSTSCVIKLDSSLRMGNRQIDSILVSEGQSHPVQVEPLEIEIIAE